MNFARIALASLGAFVAYFVVGGLSFVLVPSLKTEFLKYPNVYRPQEGIKAVMPVGMVFMFIAIVALAVIYAMLDRSATSGVRSGALFGVLVGIYAIGSFVVHNYVDLQIGIMLTVQQSIAYFVEWVVVGTVIGLIYQPRYHG
ncbi:MAG: hypothetical protein WAK13_18760 [Terriglobales bacterium]